MTVWLAVSANHSSSPACFTPSFNTRVYFARQRDLCMFFQFIFSQGFHRCRIYKTFTPKCSDFSSVRCLSNLAWNVSLQDPAEGRKLWRNQINSSFMFFFPSLLSKYVEVWNLLCLLYPQYVSNITNPQIIFMNELLRITEKFNLKERLLLQDKIPRKNH